MATGVARRLEDRIRELCARVVATDDSEELAVILADLQRALHEAVQRIRARAVETFIERRESLQEKRKAP